MNLLRVSALAVAFSLAAWANPPRDLELRVAAEMVETPVAVSPERSGDARLNSKVDAVGVVTAWRIGVPPQVHYVEGCG